jgi:hypothetical protein
VVERERRDRQWEALSQLLALVPPGGDLDEVIHLRAADLRAAVLAAIDCGWFAPAPEPGAAGRRTPMRPTEPLEVLREELAAARRRGETFEQAFPAARYLALEAATPAERSQWVTVLYETREAWMLAYDRRPIGTTFSAELVGV